jgi:hypothetical protein
MLANSDPVYAARRLLPLILGIMLFAAANLGWAQNALR